MTQKTRNAPPRAGAMMESLRGLGYSTGAALADIVDNSISAGARLVKIDCVWDGASSRISVLDDGAGMSDAELERAMRLGDKSPLDERSASDLGRFGMGLKTASFSQCRALTVASIKDGATSCLRWDLDALMSNPEGGWLLFEGPGAGSEAHLKPLASGGTLVLWEKLDRIVTKGYKADDFIDLIADIEAHLAMVFHRLLEGPRPRLKLVLNGRAVQPWDPFMTNHPAKWHSPVAPFMSDDGRIVAEGHVLPHPDKLSAAELKKGGGPEGWIAQQGIYVYRNQRLLVAGGWLGLGQPRPWNREGLHRLARIRLDIPNTADAAWKIDIRKSTARVPVSARQWLTVLAEDTRKYSREVFVHRGTPTVGPASAPLEQAWRNEQTKAGSRYRIDERHPAVASVLDQAGPLLPVVKAMLSVIQETVPIQRIWLDSAENKETPRTSYSSAPSADVVEVLGVLYSDMVGRRGMSAEDAKRALRSTEPFQNFPALVDALGAAEPQP